MSNSGRLFGLMMVVGVVLFSGSCGNGGTTSHVSTWAEVLEQRPDPKVVTDADLLKRITETKLPWRVRHKGSGIEMLLVPPGTFMMGASPGDTQAEIDEKPQHQVTISSAFYIGRYEVTQAEWQAVMAANPSQFIGNSLPVDSVSYPAIAIFLKKAGGGLTLPTEAQWEYACRAGSTGPTYGELAKIAWYDGNSAGTTHPVGKKLPNALGLYDTLGNVWERCSDWYGDYFSSPSTNPEGPYFGVPYFYSVSRGGSLDKVSSVCRTSVRYGTEPNCAYYNVGFRAARAP